jgi:hypothetical protein
VWPAEHRNPIRPGDSGRRYQLAADRVWERLLSATCQNSGCGETRMLGASHPDVIAAAASVARDGYAGYVHRLAIVWGGCAQ